MELGSIERSNRVHFKAKRAQLGLSFDRLASYLGVHGYINTVKRIAEEAGNDHFTVSAQTAKILANFTSHGKSAQGDIDERMNTVGV